MTSRPFRVLLILALSLLPLRFGAELHAQSSPVANAQPKFREGELLVKFKNVGAARSARVHASAHAERIGRMGRMEHVRLPAGMDVEGMRQWYQGQPDVEYAEPNYIVHKAAIPDDTHFDTQWGLRNIAQTVNGVTGTAGADINATSAWDKHTGDGTVVVALVDTGVDYSHPDIVNNIWTNPLDGSDGIDNDNNGKVDDIRGWDFANNDADPMDDDVDGHGTHVAGIVGAEGNNGAGVSGVNWHVKLMPLKVLRSDGFGDVANIVAAIDYAIAKGVSVINASYAFDCGDTPSQSEHDALDRARAAGILVALAAGNDGCDNDTAPTYPASHALNNLLSVGASDQFDQRATFVRGGSSNFGAQSVHLFAPGKNVYSTLRVALGSYGLENGTSMSAPHVSGAAALLKSYRPTLSMFQVREILLKTAAAKAALAGLAVTGGRLDIGAAMDFDLAVSTPIQPSHLAAVKVHDSRIDLSWLDDSTVETGWKLEYRSDPNVNFPTTPRAQLGSGSLTYADSSVQAGEGTYNGYRIKAVNNFGDSAPTAEVKLVTPPLAPTNLTASGSGDTLTVSWTDRSARESGYRLERASGGGLFSEIASLPANTTTYQDSGLSIGTEYRYRARAYSGVAGYSDYSAAAVITPQEGSGGTHVGCFIATAAYGSALHPKVNALRVFRDRYLNTNVPGRAFVAAYYRLSPPLADFIARHDWLRAGVRTLLWPLVWLAEAVIPPAEAGAFFHPTQDVTATAAADRVTQELTVERQLLVKFAPTVDAAAAQALMQAHGSRRVEAISPQLYLAEFDNIAARERARDALSGAPQVEYTEANRRVGLPRRP